MCSCPLAARYIDLRDIRSQRGWVTATDTHQPKITASHPRRGGGRPPHTPPGWTATLYYPTIIGDFLEDGPLVLI